MMMIERACKFTRAKERLRELKTHSSIFGTIINNDIGKYQQIFSICKGGIGGQVWTQDGKGSVRALTYSEIKRLLTEEKIPELD